MAWRAATSTTSWTSSGKRSWRTPRMTSPTGAWCCQKCSVRPSSSCCLGPQVAGQPGPVHPTVLPNVTLVRHQAYTDRYMPEFSADWLQQNLTVSMCVYKNLSFLACGNPDNYGAKFAFDEQFPKYAAISTLSTEFQNSGVHAQLHRADGGPVHPGGNRHRHRHPARRLNPRRA
jgi:hypothetical protein